MAGTSSCPHGFRRTRHRYSLQHEQLEARIALAVDYTVFDINPSGEPAPQSLIEFDGRIVYRDFTPETGTELFAVDPSTGQRELIADINPGQADGNPGYFDAETASRNETGFAALGGKLYFNAVDSLYGYELREYDPTTGEVSVVADIAPGLQSSNPGQRGGFGILNDRLYFSAYSPSYGVELFEFDPISYNTTRVSDIGTGAASSFPGAHRGFATIGNVLYFAADGSLGFELYQFDTATRTTTNVSDIAPGINSADIAKESGFAVVDGKLYFDTAGPFDTTRLFEFDPSTGQTSAVLPMEVTDAGRQGGLIPVGNDLFFSARVEETLSLHRFRPSDDTLVSYENTLGAGSERGFAVDGSNLYFFADWPDFGKVLTILPAGSEMVERIASAEMLISNSVVSELHAYSGRLYFDARSSDTGYELHTYDPTSGATNMVADINPGVGSSSPARSGILGVDESVYFIATNETSFELYSYAPNTQILGALQEVGMTTIQSNAGNFSNFFEFDGRLFFQANTGTVTALHAFDPFQNEVSIVGDVLGSANFAILDNKLFFSATDYPHGREIRSYDPTTNETTVVADVWPGTPSSDAGLGFVIALGGRLYFDAYTYEHGREMYFYDPATGEHDIVADLNPGMASGISSLVSAIVLNGELLFAANDGESGSELWRLVPETGVVSLIADIDAGSRWSSPGVFSGFHLLNGKLYFSARTQADGYELYEYDPINESVSMVANLLGVVSSDPGHQKGFATLQGELYFSAASSLSDVGLYKYDPVAQTSELIVDIFPGSSSTLADNFGGLVVLEDRLYFSARVEGDSAIRIHAYDPIYGVTLVSNTPNAMDTTFEGSFIFEQYDGKLYFAATDSAAGYELRSYDPLVDRTTLVADLNPGGNSSHPGRFGFAIFDDRLVFNANVGTLGDELVALTPNPFRYFDFDEDGVVGCSDIDALTTKIASQDHDLAFDLTNDALVTIADRDEWLALAGAVLTPSGNPLLPGDANLDGAVDGLDFIAWNDHKFTPSSHWCDGDFNADGFVDGLDYIAWNANKFMSSDGLAATVSPFGDPAFGLTFSREGADSPFDVQRKAFEITELQSRVRRHVTLAEHEYFKLEPDEL